MKQIIIFALLGLLSYADVAQVQAIQLYKDGEKTEISKEKKQAEIDKLKKEVLEDEKKQKDKEIKKEYKKLEAEQKEATKIASIAEKNLQQAKTPEARHKAELEAFRAEMNSKTKLLVVEMKKKHIEEKRKVEADVANADEDLVEEIKRTQAYEKRAEIQAQMEESSHSWALSKDGITDEEQKQIDALHKANQEKIDAIKQAN